jgi:Na+/melibiose symporter-like transporter
VSPLTVVRTMIVLSCQKENDIQTSTIDTSHYITHPRAIFRFNNFSTLVLWYAVNFSTQELKKSCTTYFFIFILFYDKGKYVWFDMSCCRVA